MITAVLVDDEAIARKNLHTLLQQYCSTTIQVIGEAASVDEAYSLINTSTPQLVFLDVEMHQATGFDLLVKYANPSFRCIFVTAYDKYALQAIRLCAVDFLLKPIDTTLLIQAVQKAQQAILALDNNAHLLNLIKVLAQPYDKTNKLAIPTHKGYTMLAVENIVYMEAEKNYTYIHCTDKTKIVATLSLGEYEVLMANYSFFRIHHSYIVNKAYITNYIRGDGGEVVLSTGIILPVSKRKKAEFLQSLQQ